MAWEPTNLWRPGRVGTVSGGGAVRCTETGALGYFKKTHVAEEKICSDLARILNLLVPEVRLGNLVGQSNIIAVSVAFGRQSLDVQMLRERYSHYYATPKVQDALQAASGLLAFHAWVHTEDLKDDHLLVSDDDSGVCAIAAIDFSFSLRWRDSDGGAVVAPSGPEALVEHIDPDVLGATVDRIEQCAHADVSGIVNTLPEQVASAEMKARFIGGLRSRQTRVRDAMKRWLR